MKIFFFLALSLTLLVNISNSTAQGSAEILGKIQKLKVVGSVLYIAAHPDDENTRLLAYLANELKVRTAYLSLTRGDGGQNLIGTEQGEKLGIIRTEELLAARNVDGAEQYFTRAYDFGFSKGPAETLSLWNRDSILADVVYVIRMLKPDVIITRFPTDGSGGHGHHTSSAIIAEEAFIAAADPKRFPEQLNKVQVWQAKRLVWNGFNFGGRPQSDGKDFTKLDVGGYNVLAGKSYGEIASNSRSQHKSQGFGVPMQRGQVQETFKYMLGDSVKQNIFEGIDFTWNRIAQGKNIEKLILEIEKEFNANIPENSIAKLQLLDKEILALQDDHYKWQKHAQIEHLILQCAGIFIETVANAYQYCRNDSIQFSLNIINRSKVNCELLSMEIFDHTNQKIDKSLSFNQIYSQTFKTIVPAQQSYTSPYWLRNSIKGNLFTGRQSGQFYDARNDYQFPCQVQISVNGMKIMVRSNVQYKWTDPVRGELKRAIEVRPVVEIQTLEKNVLPSKSNEFKIKVIANHAIENAILKFQESSHFTISPATVQLTMAKSEEKIFTFKINLQAAAPEQMQVNPYIEIQNESFNTMGTYIQYDHIPIHLLPEIQKIKIINTNIVVKGRKAGYIPGAGDEIPSALKLLGYEVVTLDEKLLNERSLKDLDCIVTGVRLYNTDEKIYQHHDKLMDYVQQGGNILVQYNTNNFISNIKGEIGPYPFKIGRERVTDENANLEIIIPNHKILNYPNTIESRDYEHWVQERGLYFLTDIDPKYQKIFKAADPGEKQSDGILITTQYGKGTFSYTGISFFRQLPAGVPGAYKLFANLINQNK